MKTLFILFCLFYISIQVLADIDKDTIGIWLLDEGKGEEVKDMTKNQNNGKIQGGAKWVNGKFGSALELDGTGTAIIPFSNSFAITKQITVEAWVLFTDAGKGKDMVIARIEPGFSLQKYNNDVIEGWVNIGGWKGVREVAGGETMKPNQWYHVAYIYDGSVIRTYVNGKPDRESKLS